MLVRILVFLRHEAPRAIYPEIVSGFSKGGAIWKLMSLIFSNMPNTLTYFYLDPFVMHCRNINLFKSKKFIIIWYIVETTGHIFGSG